ncbi:CAP domain-containing protein [Halosimplex halophilum]|uniref:CAP domain-containing protein n=1 Tax=Halosimplex halophilum TaxID=2559572 RepID=UPI00107F69D0|nr:CAP domain-containing protein [Halosimplex halophilum]
MVDVDVNKPTLLVAGGGAVALVVVAVLVGAALSQPNAPVTGEPDTATAVEATDLPTLAPTTTGTAAAGTGTATAAATPTATPTPYPTLTPTPTPTPTPTATPALTDIPAEAFDEREIERLVGEYINERRAAAGLDPLDNEGKGVDRLTEMARGHSVRMADIGETIHRIDGVTSVERYREHELYDRCKWSSPDGTTLRTADGNALEAVGRTVAGEPYYDNGTREFNGNETAVARAVVDAWWKTDTYRPRLTYPNADEVGVGVEITRRNDVFVTANVC